MKKVVMSEGSGGKEMNALIDELKSFLPKTKEWTHTRDDGAFHKNGLVFTTDSYVITPTFFPGGNIGKIAFCGTVNDLVVMGAKPLGISLGLVIEEGFDKKDLYEIMKTIGSLSEESEIPIVTGDTKVMEKGSLDGIIINTSGIGKAEKPLDEKINPGDKVIVSGSIGEHGAALLAKRFDIESNLVTDSKVLFNEMNAILKLIKKARDITRGGLSGVLNEIGNIFVDEKLIPMKKEVKSLTKLLGIDPYMLACEGRFVCIASEINAKTVLNKLIKFNNSARIIGEITKEKGVFIKTRIGTRILNPPSGVIVPRIC